MSDELAFALKRGWHDLQQSYATMGTLLERLASSGASDRLHPPTLDDLRVAAQALNTDAAWLAKTLDVARP